jgi:hypothetical protein
VAVTVVAVSTVIWMVERVVVRARVRMQVCVRAGDGRVAAMASTEHGKHGAKRIRWVKTKKKRQGYLQKSKQSALAN